MAKNTSEILVKVEENFTHELEEMITDGINIHITGTQIDKLQSMIMAANSQMISAMVTALQAANMGGSSGGETKIVVQLGGATVATEIFKLNFEH